MSELGGLSLTPFLSGHWSGTKAFPRSIQKNAEWHTPDRRSGGPGGEELLSAGAIARATNLRGQGILVKKELIQKKDLICVLLIINRTAIFQLVASRRSTLCSILQTDFLE